MRVASVETLDGVYESNEVVNFFISYLCGLIYWCWNYISRWGYVTSKIELNRVSHNPAYSNTGTLDIRLRHQVGGFMSNKKQNNIKIVGVSNVYICIFSGTTSLLPRNKSPLQIEKLYFNLRKGRRLLEILFLSSQPTFKYWTIHNRIIFWASLSLCSLSSEIRR